VALPHLRLDPIPVRQVVMKSRVIYTLHTKKRCHIRDAAWRRNILQVRERAGRRFGSLVTSIERDILVLGYGEWS